MIHISRWKMWAVFVLCILSILYAFPNLLGSKAAQILPSWLPASTVNLGLDLQGGSHLLLDVQTDIALQEHLESLRDLARTELRKANIGYTSLRVDRTGLQFTLRDLSQKDTAIEVVEKLDTNLQVTSDADGHVVVQFSTTAIENRISQMVTESIEIVRRRVDELGTREPSIQRQGATRILVQVPGLQDPQQLKTILSQTAKLYFRMVNTSIGQGMSAPLDTELLPMADHPEQKIAVYRQVLVSGENLIDAQPGFQEGRPVVSFRFDAVGTRKFAAATTENVGKPFAIVLDNKVLSAPNIREPIPGGSGMISGNFTTQEAQNLAVLLRAGALPAPLTVLEERTVGPGLGADSIRASGIASLAGLGLVVALALATYGLFGIFATLTLLINICMIFAALSLLGATLTLPGIAGIVLTIGVAVDANVLVFERMREEIRHGRTLISALDAGYNHALSAIIDSNLTTLIAAFILFLVGTGPVRGFAVTLSIGIVTSLFSAIMVTRIMVVLWLRWMKPKTLPM